MLLLCIFVMIVCVCWEGIGLAFAGFTLRHLTLDIQVMGGVWVCTCFSVWIYTKLPLVTLIAAWWTLAVNGSIVWFFWNEEKTLPWFLYIHSAEILFICASHAGYFLVLRKRKLQAIPPLIED